MANQQDAPFGTYRIPAPMSWLRCGVHYLPDNRLGAIGESAARRVVMAARPAPFDVEVFPAVHARLYPATNRCEKRVLMSDRTFDRRERRFLTEALTRRQASPYVMLDVGANVGLYGLWLVSEARRLGRTVRVVAIEADPVTRGRLESNVRFSGAEGAIEIEASAVGATAGEGSIDEDPRNRGGNRITLDIRGVRVPIRTLAGVVADRSLPHINIMKIDIEGMDHDVLQAFFATAPETHWPHDLIVEAGRDADDGPVEALCRRHGYRRIERTRLNALLSRDAIG